MTSRGVAAWGRANRWPLVLMLVVVTLMLMVVMGYSIGKDMALRDNRADAVAAGVR